MKKEYDFSEATPGPVLSAPPGKTRITIRIDSDVLRWFRDQVHAAKGGNYQSLINAALREYIERGDQRLADTLRMVMREEFERYETQSTPGDRARSTKRRKKPANRR